MMTAFEGLEIPDQTVDSVCDLCASTTLLRTDCGLVSRRFRPERERALAVLGVAQPQKGDTPHPCTD